MSKQAQDKLNANIARYEQINVMVGMVKEGLQAVKNHKKVSKAISTKLTEMHPEYTFFYNRDNWQTQFSIWGNGVSYDGRLFFCMGNEKVDNLGWGAFDEEIRRNDCTDYIARAKLELAVLDQLDEIAAKIDALSAEGKALCDLHIEGSLVNRVNYGASYTLQEVYPFLKR